MAKDIDSYEENVISAQDLPKTDEALVEVLTDLTLPNKLVELAEIEAAVDKVFPEEVTGPSNDVAILQLQIIANSDLTDGFVFQQPENLRDAYITQFDFGPENLKVVWHGYVRSNDFAPDND